MEKKISKTKIEKRMRKKTDEELVRTIIKLKKTNPEVAKELARPKRKMISVNLEEIKGSKILVTGKVLSRGEFKGKKVVAFNASEKAIEKIKKAGGEFVSIFEELKKNPGLGNLEVFR